MRKILAGNWKLYGQQADLAKISAFAKKAACLGKECELWIYPPASLLAKAVEVAETPIRIGAQYCSRYEEGAYTGEVSAAMIKDAGAESILIGHSERRSHYPEEDSALHQKICLAHRHNLETILCVGEPKEVRERGEVSQFITAQLEGALSGEGVKPASLSIAYEPAWAIGTGILPSLQEIEEVLFLLREKLAKRFPDWGEKIPLLYGGSINGETLPPLLSSSIISGFLIGGASLEVESFGAIIEQAAKGW